jgi:SAM-dependent methyltransferase
MHQLISWQPGFEAKYDAMIFDPLLRGYFGAGGYYNVGYWGTGAKCAEEASQALTDLMIDWLPKDSRLVADIGCGLGATTMRLAERRPECIPVAVNFSYSQLSRYRERCPTALAVQTDAACTALAESRFDAILSIEAALHFCTREDFLWESFRILKPAGSLVLTDVLFSENGWPGSWSVPPENFLENQESYRRLLACIGFVEIRIVDAYEECWGAFCRTFERYLNRQSPGDKDAEARNRDAVSALRAGTTHYLLVSARKPGD